MPTPMSTLPSMAAEVLAANWTGRATRPAPRLYPHQWSWDSAFIAIGNAHHRLDRAAQELTSLLEAQWETGMIPHIVFSPGGGDYTPNPATWDSAGCSAAPRHVATSGICQPPVHAMAARRIMDAAKAGAGPAAGVDARSFAQQVYEPLAAWHHYLHHHRGGRDGLVETWHPWETGMDNSPAWDDAMAAINPAPDEIPDYQRVDDQLMDPDDRPTDLDYDRYTFLVDQLRRHQYLPTDRAACHFRVVDVLFNSILARAEVDLAELALEAGADPEPHRLASARLASTIDAKLWSESLGMHVSVDVVADRAIPVPIAGGFGALLIPLPEQRLHRVVDTLRSRFLQPLGASGQASATVADAWPMVLPTVPVDRPWFEPTRYWRGPAWISVMWLVAEGLAERNQAETASSLRHGVLELVRRAGFREYFDPVQGLGRGSDSFSWTAALTIDLLARFGPHDDA